MKKVDATQLMPGMITGEPVYSLDHKQILVPPGVALTDKIIDLIVIWQIPFILIADENPAEAASPEDQKPVEISKNLPEAMASKTRNFVSHLETAVNTLNSLFENIRDTGTVEIKPFAEITAQVEAHLVQPAEAINNMLFHMPNRRDKNYQAYHAVAVAAMAGMLASWMELPPATISDVFLAGLLHDIGCTQQPRSLFADDTPNEQRQAMMKEHVAHGVKLLKGISGVKPEILAAVAQHHECRDGSGYPLRVSGDKIRPYAKILAFADQLCQIMEKSPGRNPFALTEDIKAQMFTKLEPVVCDTFIRRFSDYLMSHPVKLSDGRKAKVVFLPSINPTAPVLKTEDEQFIDLSKNPDVKIDKLIF